MRASEATGVNTEAGVTVFRTPRVGVSVGYAYRVMWFDRASGATDKLFYLRPRFRETSGSVAMSGLLHFLDFDRAAGSGRLLLPRSHQSRPPQTLPDSSPARTARKASVRSSSAPAARIRV